MTEAEAWRLAGILAVVLAVILVLKDCGPRGW